MGILQTLDGWLHSIPRRLREGGRTAAEPYHFELTPSHAYEPVSQDDPYLIDRLRELAYHKLARGHLSR
jgi:hypothetical protein